MKFEEIYENGKLTKTLLYYNINSEQIVSDETLFNPETNKKEKHTRYSSDGKKYWETKFDINEKKSEFNSYDNGNLILHEEYKNGKKMENGFGIVMMEQNAKRNIIMEKK